MGSFTYDVDGNLLMGAGRTISWNSFDMPSQISSTDGLNSSGFTYGADYQRTTQTKVKGGVSGTIYYGLGMEVETNGSGTTVRTYWPMDLGLEIDNPSGTTDLLWTHRDWLGSVVAITDKTGALKESMAYDSWGKRMSLTGTAADNTLDGKIDNKGYTGHEMLDGLDLVHMNGRVYDPFVARFLSADPFIQDPLHSQSYNRYTYVGNNPTNMTDPTGFLADVIAPPAPPVESCDPRCQQLEDDAKRKAENDCAICWKVSWSTSSKENAKSPIISANNSQRSFSERMEYGNANNGNPVIRDIGHFEYAPRKYATADQMMGGWIDFNFVSSLLKDAGVQSRTAEGIGFAAMMIGNPKQILSAGAKKAVAYSVAFETQIAKAGLGTRPEHFKAANAALGKVIAEDPAFARIIDELGIVLPGNRGASPANWTWHHVPDRPGVLQLVPTEQHRGSIFQQLLHPGGKGGFYQWGADY